MTGPAHRTRGRTTAPCGTVAALCAGALLASCTPEGGFQPEQIELANIDQRNIIPKSSPRQFVGTFERFCLDMISRPDQIAGALRVADYVPANRPRPGRPPTYAVDDRRPLVIVDAGSPASCAVAAESRTGQTQEARAMVARRFPNARQLDPSLFRRQGAEEIWRVSSEPETLVFTLRQSVLSPPSRYLLGVIRPN